MYEMYPPIFIRNEKEKKAYIATLGNSFWELNKKPNDWNAHIEQFFNQELNRLKDNTKVIYDSIKEIGKSRR